MTIQAKYEKGVFKPLQPVGIREGTVVEIQVPVPERPRPASIRDLGFTGMWADRVDIVDGVAYVDSLRDHPRG